MRDFQSSSGMKLESRSWASLPCFIQVVRPQQHLLRRCDQSHGKLHGGVVVFHGITGSRKRVLLPPVALAFSSVDALHMAMPVFGAAFLAAVLLSLAAFVLSWLYRLIFVSGWAFLISKLPSSLVAAAEGEDGEALRAVGQRARAVERRKEAMPGASQSKANKPQDTVEPAQVKLFTAGDV
eukprot:746239-Hanusia_phi.AAC.22